jgi:quercetin dioxygenase-like cupin family protein
MSDDRDALDFDDVLALALAESAASNGASPAAGVRDQLMARVHALPLASGPDARSAHADDVPGFSFTWADDDRWLPHPVPGIRMKILALNRQRGYATLLLDVEPGTRFPAHHHGGAEECYVVSGSLFTCGRRLTAGDFVHADSETDHGELWTEEGCRVILVVPPEEHLSPEQQGLGGQNHPY